MLGNIEFCRGHKTFVNHRVAFTKFGKYDACLRVALLVIEAHTYMSEISIIAKATPSNELRAMVHPILYFKYEPATIPCHNFIRVMCKYVRE